MKNKQTQIGRWLSVIISAIIGSAAIAETEIEKARTSLILPTF